MPYLQHLHGNSGSNQNVNSLVAGSVAENNNLDHSSPESRLLHSNPNSVQIHDQEDTKDPLSAGITGPANEVSEVISNPGSNRGPLDLIPTQETQSQNHQVNFFPERNY